MAGAAAPQDKTAGKAGAAVRAGGAKVGKAGAAAATAALAHAAAATPRAPAAEPGASAEIVLAHELGSERGAALQSLVERFNAALAGTRVVVSDQAWRPEALPHMLILGHDGESRFLGGPPLHRPLFEVMKESGQPLEAVRPAAQMSPTPLDRSGRLLALPVGLSTPVLFYNKDLFRKTGLDPESPPRSWYDMVRALAKLYDAGVVCPYTSAWPAWVHVENTSAWHNEPFATSEGRDSPAFNGLVQVKHLAMMASWQKSRYLRIFGRRDEAQRHFESGDCAILTTRSSEYPLFLRNAKFEVGVSPLPYHDDVRGAPQNTLAEGPALWITKGRSKGDYKVMARFVRFLLAAESQTEWQRTLGYLPLNRAGMLASATGDAHGTELKHNRVALSELGHKPATRESAASRMASRSDVRRILDDELEVLWTTERPAKEVLDRAALQAGQSATAASGECAGPARGRRPGGGC
ncbi:MAG: extracellular solute-binding protein [Betaproteobacteria bacterium]|nr:extracellular solute-binding protein [Betaproteobacteria bacterium]